MRRFLLLSALFVAATLIACDEDPIAPPTTGSITLKFVRSDSATNPPALQQSISAELANQETATMDARLHEKTPFSGGDAADVLPRIAAFEPSPQPDADGSTVSSATVAGEGATASASDGILGAPAAPSAIDAARIRIVGPTPRVLENQSPGSTVTVDGLSPGSYTVIFEGLVGGEVDYYGTASVTVEVGENRTATLNYGSFRPTMNAFSTPTTDMTFLVSYGAAFAADSYLVEIDVDPSFPAPIFDTVITETSIAIWVSDAGTYYARATAINQTAGFGRPGDAEAIEIRLDQDASGDDRAGAAPLGFSPDLTLSELNIAPPGDEDWFAVDACLGDVLTIETTAERLDPQSVLDTYIDVFNASQPDSFAFNDDTDGLDSYLEATIPAGGRYFIRVSGPWTTGPTGHYDLSVSVAPGPVNDGTQCGIPPGVTNGWTGDGDGVSWSSPDNWLTGEAPTTTDTVAIPATAAPELSEDVTIAGLVVATGGHVETNGYNLTLTGDLAAGFSITGDGTVILTGTDVSLSGGLPNLVVSGTVSLSGQTYAAGNVEVEGTLRLNGHGMAVGGTFSTINGTGVLEMTSANDSLGVAGAVAFNGGSTDGFLTAGKILLAGDISAQPIASTFAPSGTHRVVMLGLANRTIADVTGLSYFNHLVLQTPGTVTIGGVAQLVSVNGQLLSDASVMPIVTGGGIGAQGVTVQNMVLDNAPLTILEGAIFALDGVVFQSFPASTPQLTINRPSGNHTFNNLQFSQANGVTDIYVSAADSDAGDGETLTITLAGSTPLDGSANTVATDAVVNWTAAVVGDPAQVGFLVQPTNAEAGTVISPAIQVAVQDAATNTVTSFTGDVTVGIANNPGDGTLSGTLTATAVSGVATFSNLSIEKAGVGYTLVASSPGLDPEESGAFAVTAGPATTIALESGSNQIGGPDTQLPNPLAVKVTDAYGNGVGDSTVTWAVVSLTGGSVSPTPSTTGPDGIATTSLTLGSTLGAYTVEASVTGLAGSPVTFTATAAAIVSWVNPVDGNWSDGANWSTGLQPTESEAALITVDGTYTVTVDGNHSVANVLIGGTTGQQTLHITAGNYLQVNGAVTVNSGGGNLSLSNGIVNAYVIENGGWMRVEGVGGAESIVNAPIANHGYLVTRDAVILSGMTTHAGSVFSILGQSDVTVGNVLINQGRISLTSENSGEVPSLDVTSGGLTNEADGEITFAGPGGGYLGGPLDNKGDITVASAQAVNMDAAGILNSGTLAVTGADLNVTAAFFNSGTVNVGDNLTFGSYGATFENAGQVVMGLNSTLDLQNTTTTFATGYTVRDTRFIYIDGSALTSPSVSFAGNLTVEAGGSVEVLNNTINVESLINDGDFSLDVAHLVGAVDNRGWFGAVFGGNSITGSVYSANGADLEVDGAETSLTVNGDLVNNGVVRLQSASTGTPPTLTVTGGTFVHNQYFDSQGPAGGYLVVDSLHNTYEMHAVSGGPFTIEGPAIYSPGVFTLSDADMLVRPTTLTLEGDLYIHNNKTFTVDGGTFDFSAAMFGSGTVNALTTSTFTSSGWIHPGDLDSNPFGVLNITGDMEMTGGTVNIHLEGTTPGTDLDVFNVTGALALAGELYVNQGITPVVGDTFTVMTFGSHVGEFTGYNGLGIDDALSLVPVYETNALKLAVGVGADSVVVTPSSATLSTAGGTAALSAAPYGADTVLTSKTVTWTSLNPNVATVQQTGAFTANVTAVASGQVTIQAKVDGVPGFALVTVTITDPSPVTVWGNMGVVGRTWGVGPNDIWKCSGPDQMSRFNGTTWNPMSIPVTTFACRGLWGTSMDDVFAVGSDGVVLHFNSTEWEDQTGATSSNLLGVWGSSPDNVFAVGIDGTIIHYDGTQWVTRNSGTTTDVLSGVWGSSANDIYVVGGVTGVSSTVLHSSDGINWAPAAGAPAAGEFLRRAWGSSSTDVFAIGNAGTILRYDGSWTTHISPITDGLTGIAGSSNTDLYVVSRTGRFMRYDGFDWIEAIPSLVSDTLWSAFAVPGGDLYASDYRGYRGATVALTVPRSNLVGTGDQVQLIAEAQDGGTPIGGVVFTWESSAPGIVDVDANGLVEAVGQGSATVTATASGGASNFTTITVQIPAEVVVSPTGATLTSSGATQPYTAQVLDEDSKVISPAQAPAISWSSLHTGIATIGSVSGIAVAGFTGQAVIAATADGITGYGLLTVSYAGAQPVSVWDTIMPNPGNGYVWSTWGRNANQVYATGNVGTTLQWNGLGWIDRNPPTANVVRDIWGATSSELWTVGGGGEIMKWDSGINWDNTILSPTTNELLATWGAAPNDIHAGGLTGALIHYDGNSWTDKTNPGGTRFVRDIWGASSDTVYAVGSGCMLLRYDGSDWSQIPTSPCTATLFRVWGTTGTNVFMVGSGGLIMQYDGAILDTMTTPVASDLYGIWGTAWNEIYAVGAGGVLLHYDGRSWTQMPSGVTSSLYDLWGSAGGDYQGGWSDGVLRGFRGLPLTDVGENVELSIAAGASPDWLLATPYRFTDRMDITHLSVIMKTAGGNQARLAIYSDNGGIPNQLLAETAIFGVTAAGTYEEPVLQRVRLEPGTYWFAHLYDVTTPVGLETAGGPGHTGQSGYPFASGFPVTFPASTTFPGTRVNYYARGYVVP